MRFRQLITLARITVVFLLISGFAAPAGAQSTASADTYGLPFIRAQKVVVLSAEVPGLVATIAHEPQDYVRQGDLIMQLDDEMVKLDITATQAQIDMDISVEGARIRLEYASENLKIIQEMYDTVLDSGRVGSPKELQEAKQNKELMELEHEKAMLNLKLLKLKLQQQKKLLEKHSLRSPMDAVFVPFSSIKGVPAVENAKRPEAGEMLQTYQPVAALMKVDVLRISLPQPVEQIDKVRQGRKARVYVQSAPDEPIPATVVFKSPTIASTGQFDIEVEFANPPLDEKNPGTGIYPYKFRPGMRARVELLPDN